MIGNSAAGRVAYVDGGVVVFAAVGGPSHVRANQMNAPFSREQSLRRVDEAPPAMSESRTGSTYPVLSGTWPIALSANGSLSSTVASIGIAMFYNH